MSEMQELSNRSFIYFDRKFVKKYKVESYYMKKEEIKIRTGLFKTEIQEYYSVYLLTKDEVYSEEFEVFEDAVDCIKLISEILNK